MPEFQDTHEFRAARERHYIAREETRKRLRSILNAADGRELTNSQRMDASAAVMKMMEACVELAKHVPAEHAKDLKDYVATAAKVADNRDGSNAAWVKAQLELFGPEPVPETLPSPGMVHPAAGGKSVSDEVWRGKDGAEVKVLKPDQKLGALFPAARPSEQLSFGKYLRGIVTGDWRGATAEQKAMSEGVLAGGGYLVPSPLSASVIDRARNVAQVVRAGAVTIPMLAQTLAIARVTGDPTAAWHAEAAAIAGSDLTFDRVTFTAQTLAAAALLSVELAEDAANADSVIADTLGLVLGLELDRAAMRGSGTPPEPKGIRFQTGVGVDTTTFGANGSAISGTTPTGAVAWDWLSKAIYAVRGLNEYPNAVLYSERTGGELDLLRASTGEPLAAPASVAAIRQLSTNAIINTVTQGTSTDCSSAYVGDFSKLMIGMRTELQIEVSRAATVGAVSAWNTLQVGIRAYLRADIQLARPAAFRVVEGIR